MSAHCRAGIPLATLVDYHLGALGTDEEGFELHLFGCDACARRLGVVAALGTSVRQLAARGRVFAGVTAEHLDRLADAGLRLRTYRIAPGGSVHCTIAPDDDANVVRLAADFTGIDDVDLVVHAPGPDGAPSTEVRHGLPIDRASGEAVLLYPGDVIRTLPQATFRLELVGQGGRRLGEYTMHHNPWPA